MNHIGGKGEGGVGKDKADNASLADTTGDRKIPRPWRMVLARVKALLEIWSSPVTCIRNLLLSAMMGGTMVHVIMRQPKTTNQP